METDVLIIGAGPAGMSAACRCAESGCRTVILERNEKAGRKLAITGKGRCNLTNAVPLSEYEEQIISNPRFMLSSLHRFSNQDVVRWFEAMGVPLKEERGHRVFPVSDRAYDIVDALVKTCRKHHVTFRFQTTAQKIEKKDDRFFVRTNHGIFSAKRLIIATGGISYPQTGSQGDGYAFARSMGLAVVDPKPALVPLECPEEWVHRLQGLSLRNIRMSLSQEDTGQCIYTDFGEMLFTHFGVSGPVILSASSHLQKAMTRGQIQGGVRLHIDLKPALDEETLTRRVFRDFHEHARKHLKGAMENLLPKRMIPVVIQESGLDEELTAGDASTAQVKALVRTLKNLTCRVTGFGSFQEAIITQGGVDVKEINPKTMESKKIPGLYFAGEVLDVDALTGGFNLQIAFSTGHASGVSASGGE